MSPRCDVEWGFGPMLLFDLGAIASAHGRWEFEWEVEWQDSPYKSNGNQMLSLFFAVRLFEFLLRGLGFAAPLIFAARLFLIVPMLRKER